MTSRRLAHARFLRVRLTTAGPHVDAAVTDGLIAVSLPKAASAGEILALHDLLSYHEGKAGLPHGAVGILPLPETAEGMQDAHALAKASRARGVESTLRR